MDRGSWVRSLGQGVGEGRKYLCSHLNVNQVWLEQGSRNRGGRSKRQPDRREEAEMGVVRGSVAERAKRERESQAVLGKGARGSHRGLTSKAIKGDRRGSVGGEGVTPAGQLRTRGNPALSPYPDGKTEAREAKASAQCRGLAGLLRCLH